MKPGHNSILISRLLNPKIAHLLQRPSTRGGAKHAIVNLGRAGCAGTAVGLRTAALSLVTPIVERPCEKEKSDANTLARPSLRRANVVEETRLYFDRNSHAGARNRREHGD